MKVTAVAVPLVVVSLIFALVWGVSMVTLKMGVRAIEGGLELLRLQVRVARLQDAVLVHSRQSLERQLEELDVLAAHAAAWSPEVAVDLDPSLGPPDVGGTSETEAWRERPSAEPRSGSTSTPVE
jgi:hypothetical protein